MKLLYTSVFINYNGYKTSLDSVSIVACHSDCRVPLMQIARMVIPPTVYSLATARTSQKCVTEILENVQSLAASKANFLYTHGVGQAVELVCICKEVHSCLHNIPKVAVSSTHMMSIRCLKIDADGEKTGLMSHVLNVIYHSSSNESR